MSKVIRANRWRNSNELTTERRGVDNLAYRWGQMALTATANDTERFRAKTDHHLEVFGTYFCSRF